MMNGMAGRMLHATSVAFGAVGFDCLLAAALGGPRTANMLAQAAILMGIAAAMLWAKERC
jgi:hypothetical protein